MGMYSKSSYVSVCKGENLRAPSRSKNKGIYTDLITFGSIQYQVPPDQT